MFCVILSKPSLRNRLYSAEVKKRTCTQLCKIALPESCIIMNYDIHVCFCTAHSHHAVNDTSVEITEESLSLYTPKVYHGIL